ncbi:MAG: MurR/RpiR family transcriptional regulator, partial [bacterium]
MPNTIRELKTRIRYKIPYLTEPQKTIANYIIENIQKFALSSIRELEEELNTSKSTIVRLSQALGYGGFQELKAAIVKSMRRDLDPNNRYQAFLSEPFDDSSHLKLVADEA